MVGYCSPLWSCIADANSTLLRHQKRSSSRQYDENVTGFAVVARCLQRFCRKYLTLLPFALLPRNRTAASRTFPILQETLHAQTPASTSPVPLPGTSFAAVPGQCPGNPADDCVRGNSCKR